MRRNEFLSTMAASGDVINTLGGGMSQPTIKVTDDMHARNISVRVPGVNGADLEVEVNNNNLSVFHSLPFASWGKQVMVPHVVLNRVLPYFINVAGISASLTNNTLTIRLPFNERANGYNKRIRISQP